MVAKIWDYDLSKSERITLLRAAYPNRSFRVTMLEARLKWNKLLPSTQLELRNIPWNVILDRSISPD